MEMESSIKEGKTISPKVNRIAYAAFVLLALYFAIRGDASMFCTQFGIALVFDPFDQTQTWKARPIYQRAWLISHVAILFTAFGLLISGYFG